MAHKKEENKLLKLTLICLKDSENCDGNARRLNYCNNILATIAQTQN